MRFSVNWLKEIVDLDLSPEKLPEKLAEKLTMAGLEVESITPACQKFTNVYTAEIIGIKQHPDADKLRICSVKYNNQVLQIVCGAANACVNAKVALAIAGATLQDGKIKIKNSKIRGVESQGMLCSKQELGFPIAEGANDGIWLLPYETTPLDVDLYEYLKLDDNIIELSLTPNRGDCLSLRGVARETAVLTDATLTNQFANNLVSSKIVSSRKIGDLKINIAAKEACPKYTARIVKNLDPKAVTPVWMQERLRRSGIKSIFPLVDITNYVMLELGQPMHAFDLSKLGNEITVRLANSTVNNIDNKQEKLVLLDNTEITLNNKDLVISSNINNHDQPVALAGVMGGIATAISASTSNVLLESAFFTPQAILGRGRAHGIVSDSAQRFERGVDPAISKLAMERATELLLEIASTADTIVGEIIEIINVTYFTEKYINLRHDRIKRILGIEIDSKQVINILTRLGLELISNKQSVYNFKIPSHRFDLVIEEDLLEELARIYGYNSIPNVNPVRSLELQPAQANVTLLKKIRNILSDRGYHETVNYSFIDNKLQSDFYKLNNNQILKLINPISNTMSEMRLSLCPGLIRTAEYNFNNYRSDQALRLYEIGKCFYLNNDNTVTEVNKLAGILAGIRCAENWHDKAKKIDFFDGKGDLEVLFSQLGLLNCRFITADPKDSLACPAMHPGQSAFIIYHNKCIGWVGKMHPQVSKKTDLDNSVILFELSLEELQMPSYTNIETSYKEISKMPVIKRDLAFLLKVDIKAEQLLDLVTNSVGGLLKSLEIFDVYQGDGIPNGYKSIAFSMILQHQDKTLVDDEIVSVVSKVVEVVTNKLAGQLRE